VEQGESGPQISAKALLRRDRALISRSPFRAGAAHVVKLGPVGIEQSAD
jgi:hypothetical protein